MTCKEAAEILLRRAQKSTYQVGIHRLNAMAQVLRYFGDTPVPEEFVKNFRLESKDL